VPPIVTSVKAVVASVRIGVPYPGTNSAAQPLTGC
jgi:hypothetical protein